MLDEAMELFHEISQKGPIPDIVTYNILMQSMFQLEKVSTACELLNLKKMFASGHIGHIEVAKELFHKLAFNGLKPDVYTYTIMINGLSKEGLPDEAHQLFRSMGDNDCLPNSCCYNVMIRGFLRNNYTLRAAQFLAEMVGKGFSADIYTATLFVNLILGSDKLILM
ncbi:hypothetical protein V6N13_121514 [Hibiscus sabdariffa]